MGCLDLAVSGRGSAFGEFKYVGDHRSGKIVVELNGRSNKCGVINPHFDVELTSLESMEGVISVFRSRTLRLHTTRSWDFLGLRLEQGKVTSVAMKTNKASPM
ncbi:hypothetical protein IFM89_036272 [Coptis chinensis]|uniref:Uncharacterized protein n=1 Tax=Coptis chinensis TaxID=261450 RepID=A0A835HRV9_9MAGN|nr:hypothetical protein IFM89_036272 [Coptis chinensis]